MPTAIAYVDGFNLYRRCLERYPDAKWLDLPGLIEDLLPGYDVLHVHYFTARIRAGAGDDATAPARQQAYLRALESTGRVTPHYGTFRMDVRQMPKHPAEIVNGELTRVSVRKQEEKGSDVNLAVRVLLDAHRSEADLYCILTNDSDQVTTIKTLQEEVGVDVCWISPLSSTKQSKDLKKTGPARIECITGELLLANQLPDVIQDGKRLIHRPESWRENPKAPTMPGPSNR